MIIINYFVTKKLKELTAILGSFLKILHKHIIMLLEDMSYTYVCMHMCLKIVDVRTIMNIPR